MIVSSEAVLKRVFTKIVAALKNEWKNSSDGILLIVLTLARALLETILQKILVMEYF